MQKKTLLSRVIVVGLLFLVFNLVKTMVQTYTASQRVGVLEDEVVKLQSEQQVVLEEQAYKKTGEFIESEARNKLQLIKPGETVVVFSPGSPEGSGEKITVPSVDVSVVDQWINLVLAGLRL